MHSIGHPAGERRSLGLAETDAFFVAIDLHLLLELASRAHSLGLDEVENFFHLALS
jgi:hypothetical protein